MQTERSRAKCTYEPFCPPKRLLLGPGPSPVDDRIVAAMAAPVLGHLDPLFLRCMDDLRNLLRHVFETENRVTIPISATGSAGMEAALVNVIEPGDEVVVCIASPIEIEELPRKGAALPHCAAAEPQEPPDLQCALSLMYTPL